MDSADAIRRAHDTRVLSLSKGADGRLLQQFAAERSEAAFEEIVRRHGRMIFGVCQRLLNDPHDAEDAFQAVFLVLARNAAKLRKSDSVASWLHGVASRVGLNARRQMAKRREHERRVAEMAKTETETAWRDLGPVLDEELGRLPERLRAPVVLCYLENKSTEEAAKELGWTHGALRGRLAKAREVLRGRLSRKGVAVGAGVLAALVTRNASAASVPPACATLTVQAASAVVGGGGLAALSLSGISTNAISLADVTIRAMTLAKVKLAACAALSVIALAGGAGLVATLALTDNARTDPPAASDSAEARLEAGPPTAGVVGIAPSAAGSGADREEEDGPLLAPPTPEPITGPAAAALPDEARRALSALYPGARAENVKTEREEGELAFEVELTANGRDIEVLVSPEGAVLESSEEVAPADLPDAVLAAIGRLYPQATIGEVDKGTRAGDTTFEVELEIDGEELDVKLAPDGRVIEVEEERDEGPDADNEDEDGEEELDGSEEDVEGGDANSITPDAEAF